MRIRSILDAIEDFAPRALQESYDNAGLQAGDATNDCTGVLLTLDVSERTVDEARERGCNLIVSHHPLLFKGVKTISPTTSTGRILIKAIKNDIAIYAAHTNLDNARNGVSYRMAAKLGLTNIQTLEPQQETLAKIAVFVPDEYADKVTQALFEAGAGEIGDYKSCCYRTKGIGSFEPNEDANPFIGENGEVCHTEETKIEVIIPTWKVDRAIRNMIAAHPYEEPAYDVFPLKNADNYSGSGVVGDIEPARLEEFLNKTKSIFNVGAIRYAGDKTKTIRRVALCGGSGAFLIGKAIASGADLYITGDVKYHDFTTYEGQIAIADIGHYESEQCTKEIFYEIIQKNFPNFASYFAETDTNPINYL